MAADAPAGPPPTISTSKASLPESLAASRRRAGIDLGEGSPPAACALAKGLAVGDHRRHRHDLEFIDAVLKIAPSIMVWLILGLSTAIRLSACTTSGSCGRTARCRFEVDFGSERANLLDHRPSTLGGWPPVWSRASTSEVNSCPIGMPAKLIRAVSPGRPTLKEGRSSALLPSVRTATFPERLSMSCSKPCISCDFRCRRARRRVRSAVEGARGKP